MTFDVCPVLLPGHLRDMVRIGYTLSSEEHGPGDLLLYGRIAEESGFDFLTISDHFHPWTRRAGAEPLRVERARRHRRRRPSRSRS